MMKKIFFVLVAMMCSISMSAQQVKAMKGNTIIATYSLSQVDKVVFEYAAVATTGTATATIGGNNVDVKWTQLWSDGPKFAEYNVGVTDGNANNPGGRYCWGKTVDKDSNSDYNSGTQALNGSDDTATALWGSNWRMPTRSELEALMTNCTVTSETTGGVKGLRFTGKGDYSENSIFLPAAGFSAEGNVLYTTECHYWSSTPAESNTAYELSNEYSLTVTDNFRWFGQSVRAVLAE